MVGQLDSLGIAGRSGRVAERVRVSALGLFEGVVLGGGGDAFLLHLLPGEDAHAEGSCCFDAFLAGLVVDDQVRDLDEEACLLHLDHPVQVVSRHEERGQAGLVDDEIDGGVRHGIEQTDTGGADVHAGQGGHEPLGSVLRPDSSEAPHLSLTLDLGAEVELARGTGHVLGDIVDVTVADPVVRAELSLSLIVLSILGSVA